MPLKSLIFGPAPHRSNATNMAIFALILCSLSRVVYSGDVEDVFNVGSCDIDDLRIVHQSAIGMTNYARDTIKLLQDRIETEREKWPDDNRARFEKPSDSADDLEFKVALETMTSFLGIRPEKGSSRDQTWEISIEEENYLKRIQDNYRQIYEALNTPEEGIKSEIVCGDDGMRLVKTFGDFLDARKLSFDGDRNDLLSGDKYRKEPEVPGYYIAVSSDHVPWVVPWKATLYASDPPNTANPHPNYCASLETDGVIYGELTRLTNKGIVGDDNDDQIVKRIHLCDGVLALPLGLADVNGIVESGTKLSELRTIAQTFLHEMAHYIDEDITDIEMINGGKTAYGAELCMKLAFEEKFKPISNADSYALFALAVSFPGWDFSSGIAADM
ncbi:hypothetical protein B0O99DRAFT_672901 [Bisporella sp. PMI_857]|nr:hypothetical protein B0O99DRAFT_672901 [Bisporella sp. PMI_857]